MLVAMNLVPLGGAIFAGWDVGFILLVYWAENLVVGFYNVLKMAIARGGKERWHPVSLGLIPFFAVHYGIFCLVHGVFVLVLGQSGKSFRGDPIDALLGNLSGGLLWPMLALVVSHGCSFLQNYVGKGEYKTRSVQSLMIAPYGRIVLLHVVILFGGFVVMLFNSPLPLLILLIGLKILIDLFLHAAAHQSKNSGGVSGLADLLKQSGRQR